MPVQINMQILIKSSWVTSHTMADQMTKGPILNPLTQPTEMTDQFIKNIIPQRGVSEHDLG